MKDQKSTTRREINFRKCCGFLGEEYPFFFELVHITGTLLGFSDLISKMSMVRSVNYYTYAVEYLRILRSQ